MATLRGFTGWVRTLNPPSPWQGVAWGQCREDCTDALEDWIRNNQADNQEWVILPDAESPQPERRIEG